MQLTTVLSTILPVVAAGTIPRQAGHQIDTGATGPSGHEVTIGGIAFAGSGCPAGSVAGQLSDDATLITLAYDQFVAQAGKGIKPAEQRKNCQLNVKIRYPSGWQYSVFKADIRGYASIPKGATGTCRATYYFSGETKQIMSTTTFKGPYDDNYLKTDQFGVESTVWSPCGKEGLININSEVRITPLDANVPALLTVDSTDLKFTQEHYLQWQKC